MKFHVLHNWSNRRFDLAFSIPIKTNLVQQKLKKKKVYMFISNIYLVMLILSFDNYVSCIFKNTFKMIINLSY